jgi:hypothetical protein
MADFHPPAFEEMIEEGKKLFNSPRMRHARRKSGQSRATAPQDAKRRVTVFRQDKPEGERTADYTLDGFTPSGLDRRCPWRHFVNPDMTAKDWIDPDDQSSGAGLADHRVHGVRSDASQRRKGGNKIGR